jgi:hypothetical protein
MKTQEEYLEANGTRCPFCDSSRINSDAIQVEGISAWADVGCDDCLKSWTDKYALIGFEPHKAILKNKWKLLAVSTYTANEATAEEAVAFYDAITDCATLAEEEIVLNRFPAFLVWEHFVNTQIAESMAALAEHAQDLDNSYD